jgi:divalent metal cation (Fe/Co/Zn/Cd) transporter
MALAAARGTHAALDTRAALRRGRRLEYLTLGWNILEGFLSVGVGIMAGSTALVGFGADSFIESASGGILLWRLQDHDEHAEREATALKLVGWSFLLLAAYVGFDAAQALWTQAPPDATWIGIVIAALSLVVMPVLAHHKRRVAGALDSRAMEADSRQTDLCAYLSAILLAGLLLNALLGWWWADPVAGLIMVPIIANEGRGALRGDVCDGSCH